MSHENSGVKIDCVIETEKHETENLKIQSSLCFDSTYGWFIGRKYVWKRGPEG